VSSVGGMVLISKSLAVLLGSPSRQEVSALSKTLRDDA